jgi:S-DNA-T family DNA segregation ATPase FtsK/SpoIIIE
MAYHQAGRRDPLLDSSMQDVIERRGRELVGLVVALIGAYLAMTLMSYSPTDPSWLAASDAPVNNWMGMRGASISATLIFVIGLAAWSLSLVFLVWGVRLMFHQGDERVLSRIILVPFFVIATSIYASSLDPGQSWAHVFGMGGRFGDTGVGSLLVMLPFSTEAAIRILSIVSGVAVLALGILALGFELGEIRKILRFLALSLVMTYAHVMQLMGRGTAGAMALAGRIQERHQAKREERAALEQEMASWGEYETQAVAVPRAPVGSDLIEDPVEAPVKTGLLAKVPNLIKRAEKLPEPELVEREAVAHVDHMPEDDRVKSKIAAAIRNRAVPPMTAEPQDAPIEEKRHEDTPGFIASVIQGRRRKPDAMILDDMATTETGRKEPPLTANSVPSAPAYVEDPALFEETLDDEMDLAPMSYDMAPAPVAPQVEALPLQTRNDTPELRSVVQHAPRKAVQPSTRAKEEAQPTLAFEDHSADFELPPLSLLENPVNITRHQLSDDALAENARMLESVLDDYGVKGEIVSVRPGPVVTMYELEPAPGLKASRVIGLADDIARSMSALSARVSTVPGRSVIGIELPNENREKVVLREILSSRDFGDGNYKLPLALGKDIGGDPVVANLAKMPHLLIAGTTGSGKSVAINTMILSLLYKLTPEECRLIMIDPKMLELSVYDGIPHLLSPVVTDPKKAVVALKWVVGEMEERYRKMSKMGVRNIDGYNGRVEHALAQGEMFSRTVQTGFDDETGEPIFETEEFAPEKMPYIVVIVDEMADLMMVAGKEIEACIQRLAQMARASGIHLIMATQRPSVDVITGTIKANFPTRISFQVTSKIDSRTILGEMGAEQLLGMGDMLYMAGGSKITRCHGPFVSDEEVEEIVNHLKSYGPPEYMSGVVEGPDDDKADSIDMVLGLGGNTDGEDALYDQAVAIVIKDRKCSTSYIQRKLAIGYNKAARLVEQMEDQGLVTPANHVGKREILVPEQQ